MIVYFNLPKDATVHTNLTSYVVACSIGNITIRDLQDAVTITIKHTVRNDQIQVRELELLFSCKNQ